MQAGQPWYVLVVSDFLSYSQSCEDMVGHVCVIFDFPLHLV